MRFDLLVVISLLCLAIGCENTTRTTTIHRSIERSITTENDYMACGKPWYRQVGSNEDIVEIEWGCPITNKMNIVRNMTVRGLLEDGAGNIVVDSMAIGMVDPGKTETIKRKVSLTKTQAARVVGIGVQASNQ